jgi:Terpene synthase family 2, C-terminal metal binding
VRGDSYAEKDADEDGLAGHARRDIVGSLFRYRRSMRNLQRSRMKMGSIRLPMIYCPFPSAISPHVEAVNAHTLAWATRLGLVKEEEDAIRHLSRSRFAWLTARVYPLAGLDELKLLNDWAIWLLLFDDQFDEGPAGKQPECVRSILNDYLAICSHPTTVVSPSPAAAALGDLCQRTFARMPDAWRQRFTEHFAQHLDAFNWTVSNTAQGHVPALEEYLEKRRHSGGLFLAIDLIELAEQIELTAEHLASPEFGTLACTTNDVVCWSNDLFSLEKELARGDVNNLVIVLQHVQGLSLQQAVDHVNEMLGDAVHQFEQTEHALPACAPGLGEAIQKYVGNLKAWMRGNLDWSIETARYSQVERIPPDIDASYLEPIVVGEGASVRKRWEKGP